MNSARVSPPGAWWPLLIDTCLSTVLADGLALSSGGVSFTVVDRHRLIALLAGTGEANEVCREALHHGATFTITAVALPASHFVPIYKRREQHCRRKGIATAGFDQAVERLEAAQDQPLRLG